MERDAVARDVGQLGYRNRKGGDPVQVLLSGDMGTTSKMFWSIRRHGQTVLRHVTPRKFFNIGVCLLEMALKRSVLVSHPFFFRIEVCPFCNLRCPGCLLGGQDVMESNPDHRNKMMSYEMFVDSIRGFLPYLVKVSLYDEGEPLLNKNIYQMIEYLRKHNVGTCVSSNFSFSMSDETLRKLLGCGLEHLIISIDGATQETYSEYRKGGDLSLVIANVERLLSMRRSVKNRLKIEIQFIEFQHNRADRAGIHALARKWGVWRFTVLEGGTEPGWREVTFRGSEEERRRRGCFDLWISATVNSEGELGICDYGEDHGISNIGMAREYRMRDLRNHPRVVEMRNSFRGHRTRLHPVCRYCTDYRN